MIKRFLLISITYLAIQINAQDNKLNWYDDVSKAIPVSIQENKPLLLFFTGSDWCGWCIRLKREVF